MSRRDDIINELELADGVQLHANDIPGDILCQHDTCINEGCGCWVAFVYEIENILSAQVKAAEMAENDHARLLNAFKDCTISEFIQAGMESDKAK